MRAPLPAAATRARPRPPSVASLALLFSALALILLSPSPLHRSPLWSSPCCPGVCLVPLSVPLEDLHIFELMVGAHGTRIMCGMLWLGGGLQWHSVRSLSPQVLSRGARGRRGPAQLLAPQLMRWRRCCAADNQQHALGARSAPHGACAALTADMPANVHPDIRRYPSTKTTVVGRQAHSDAWATSCWSWQPSTTTARCDNTFCCAVTARRDSAALPASPWHVGMTARRCAPGGSGHSQVAETSASVRRFTSSRLAGVATPSERDEVAHMTDAGGGRLLRARAPCTSHALFSKSFLRRLF